MNGRDGERFEVLSAEEKGVMNPRAAVIHKADLRASWFRLRRAVGTAPTFMSRIPLGVGTQVLVPVLTFVNADGYTRLRTYRNQLGVGPVRSTRCIFGGPVVRELVCVRQAHLPVQQEENYHGQNEYTA